MKPLHFRFRFGVWWCRNRLNDYGGHAKTVNEAYSNAMKNKQLKTRSIE